MSELYLRIRLVHVVCVCCSGVLFMARGLMALAAAPLANHPVLRRASYLIDTCLLIAALMLVFMLQQYPFVQAWLTVKVLLLVVYIVLGVFALRRARTRRVRLAAFVAALLVYLFIVSVAYWHDPLGWFAHSVTFGTG